MMLCEPAVTTPSPTWCAFKCCNEDCLDHNAAMHSTSVSQCKSPEQNEADEPASTMALSASSAMDDLAALCEVLIQKNSTLARHNEAETRKDLRTVTKYWQRLASRTGKENAPDDDVLAPADRKRKERLVKGARCCNNTSMLASNSASDRRLGSTLRYQCTVPRTRSTHSSRLQLR